MPSTAPFLQYCIDQLSPLPVTSRKMMGEYLLYTDGTLFGGVYDDRLLLKITPSNASQALPTAIPYPGAKPMYAPDVDDASRLVKLVSNTLDDLAKR